MKITNLYLATEFPRGYGANDPRLLTGAVEVRVSKYDTVSHKLSAETLSKMADLAMADFKANGDVNEIPDVLVFEECDIPPIKEAPAVNGAAEEQEGQ